MIRLSKTHSANTEHTLDLDVKMDGTDIASAAWTIDAVSVPFWLSLPLQGSIGATEKSGNLSLTASTSGLPERLATPYEALLNLNVTAQYNRSFLVLVQLYVSAPTLASTSIWGQVSGPAIGSTSGERACHIGAAATDDDPSRWC